MGNSRFDSAGKSTPSPIPPPSSPTAVLVSGRRAGAARVYWEIAKSGFRRYSRYRSAVLAAVFTNTVFGMVRASLLLTALDLSGGPVGGYDAAMAATYVWLGQALIGPFDIWGGSQTVGARIKNGDIAVDFLRPVSIAGAAHAANLGRAAFEVLPRGIPPLVVGALVTGLHVPGSPTAYLLGAWAILVAVALNFAFYLAVSLTALWSVENRGFVVLASVLHSILSGFLVPVSWFPGWLRTIAQLSPFPSMIQTPIDLLTERLSGADAWQAVGVQALWLVVLAGLGQAMLHAGRRKVVILGG